MDITVLIFRGIHCGEHTEEHQIPCAVQMTAQPASTVFVAVFGFVSEGCSLPLADFRDMIDDKHILRRSRRFAGKIDFIDACCKRTCAVHCNNAHTVELAHIRCLRALRLCRIDRQIQFIPTALLYIIGQRPPELLLIYRIRAGKLQHTACQVFHIVNIEPDVQVAIVISCAVLVRESAEKDNVVCCAVGCLEPGCTLGIAAGRFKRRYRADPVALSGHFVNHQHRALRRDPWLHSQPRAEHLIVKDFCRQRRIRT